MKLPYQRPVAAALLMVHLSACSTWQPSPVVRPNIVADGPPEQLRVTRSSGQRIVLHEPMLRTDSILGHTSNLIGMTSDVSIALSDIQQVEVKELHLVRTMLLTPIVIYGALVLGLSVGSFAVPH